MFQKVRYQHYCIIDIKMENTKSLSLADILVQINCTNPRLDTTIPCPNCQVKHIFPTSGFLGLWTVTYWRDPAQVWGAVEVNTCILSEIDLSYISWHCFYSLQLITFLIASTKFITYQVLLCSEMFV